jgi:hypothetical protein
VGIIAAVGAAAEASGVSLGSVMQLPSDPVSLVVLTARCKRSQIQHMVDAIAAKPFCAAPTLVMGMLSAL